jgi:hypothetical protein
MKPVSISSNGIRQAELPTVVDWRLIASFRQLREELRDEIVNRLTKGEETGLKEYLIEELRKAFFPPSMVLVGSFASRFYILNRQKPNEERHSIIMPDNPEFKKMMHVRDLNIISDSAILESIPVRWEVMEPSLHLPGMPQGVRISTKLPFSRKTSTKIQETAFFDSETGFWGLSITKEFFRNPRKYMIQDWDKQSVYIADLPVLAALMIHPISYRLLFCQVNDPLTQTEEKRLIRTAILYITNPEEFKVDKALQILADNSSKINSDLDAFRKSKAASYVIAATPSRKHIGGLPSYAEMLRKVPEQVRDRKERIVKLAPVFGVPERRAESLIESFIVELRRY